MMWSCIGIVFPVTPNVWAQALASLISAVMRAYLPGAIFTKVRRPQNVVTDPRPPMRS